jgi:hypothetical protein
MITVISLGAGVQSSTMALMAAHGELTPMPDCAIFADTGAEPKGVYDYLDWLTSVLPFPVHIVVAPGADLRTRMLNAKDQPNSDWRPPLYAINDIGEAGPLNRQCTRYYKIRPIQRKMRELLGIKPHSPGPKTVIAEQWIGISLDESIRMKPSSVRYSKNRWPLIEQRMRRWDCLQWMQRHGYPKPTKSACTFCPYRDNAGWRAMRDNDPASWADAVAIDAAVRNNLPKVRKNSVFVHRSLKPLDQVDLSTPEDRGQLNLFLNECEGMCGV